MPDPGARRAGGASWRCRRSRSPTTARSPARSSSIARRASRGSSRSSAARSTSPTTARGRTKGYAHLTLLAETNEGYANLIKLCSLGYLEGYYYKPRVDWELLERHAPGLVALSGLPVRPGLQGARGGAAAGRRSRARPARRRSSAATRPTSRSRTPASTRSSGSTRSSPGSPRRRGLPLVATGDVHYLAHDGRARPRGAALHPVRRLAEEPEPLAVRHRPVLLQDARGDGARLPACPRTRCGGRSRWPSAATSRSSSAGSCCRSYPTPDGRDAFEYLVELCEEGLARALRDRSRPS